MKTPNAAEIEKQFMINVDAYHRKHLEYINPKTPQWRKQILKQEMETLNHYQNSYSVMFTQKTGQALFANLPVMPTDNDIAIEDAALQEQNETAARLEKNQQKLIIKQAIDSVRTDLTRLQNVCMREFEHSHANRGFAGLVNTVGGNGMFKTAVIFNNAKVDVTAALEKAASHADRAQFPQAWTQLSIAALKLKNGFDAFNKWQDDREVGAARTESAIKVSAAVATLVATAPAAGVVSSQFLYSAALAGGQEASTQVTLLIARIVDGKDQITAKDLFQAQMEVNIATVTPLVANGFGRALARGIAGPYAQKVLGHKATPEQLEWLTKRIEQVVAANFAEWSKDVVGLNKEPTWDSWQRIVGPLLDKYGVGSELMKEKDLNKGLYPVL